MTHNFLEYGGLSAQKFLERVEQVCDFTITPPIDVDKIVQLLDIRLTEDVDFDKISIAGSVSIKHGHAVIWLNPMENNYSPRRRFTLAHELAHLILHIDPEIGIREFIDTGKTLNRKDSYWDSKEYEANNFAAQLLMPIDLLKEYGNNIIDSHKEETGDEKMPVTVFLGKMADLFNVSEPAMRFRLKNIGAIK
uniref:IrrE N-terminal-like domain-containing protein n=1 Tax=Candidatus Kentrum sp. FM TaxID=2126340 RepID=A0A450WRH2_9GAMM|nr:MAG: protein of unknown function (DUF955) [Candidatus Kentron sp. FM]VFJ72789.1 MAG: protein of unknown function (DUF955) [Candidatus Kentron sp. FM]VFK19643.1 MAG: protein of unknown function (DUF955) [Candidatus Kentron sp. FM]